MKNNIFENYKIVEAPWKLAGKGYIFLFNFKKDFVLNNCFIDQDLRDKFISGFGAVMIVDYRSSNVGPYSELLIIPGKFKNKNKVKYTISKIYVSSYDSVYSGRHNWAIPKEYAEFKFEKLNEENNKNKNVEKIIVKKDGKEFFKVEIKNYLLKFPVSTIFLPFPIFQINNHKIYYTKFNGYGIGYFCKIQDLEIDQNFFPNISNEKLLFSIKVEPFNIVFPKAKIEDI